MHNRTHKNICSTIVVTALLIGPMGEVMAGPDPYIGEINYVAFDYPPRNWTPCDGQLLKISQNNALFALLGTRYGGDGRTTFAVPDMRGRVPIHMGRGPGLSNYILGFRGGVEATKLTLQQMPDHSHQATATSTSVSAVSGGSVSATLNVAKDNDGSVAPAPTTVLAKSTGRSSMYTDATPSVDYTALSPDSITTSLDGLAIATQTDTTVNVSPSGAGGLFSIVQPYQVVNCIIATDGTFPPRQ